MKNLKRRRREFRACKARKNDGEEGKMTRMITRDLLKMTKAAH
jgi:hypothetical protein